MAAVPPDALHDLYLRWRAGLISSEIVSRERGPAILEALQTEHPIYLSGEHFFRATHGEAMDTEPLASTAMDTEDGG